jgi:hypothetical protein
VQAKIADKSAEKSADNGRQETPESKPSGSRRIYIKYKSADEIYRLYLRRSQFASIYLSSDLPSRYSSWFFGGKIVNLTFFFIALRAKPVSDFFSASGARIRRIRTETFGSDRRTNRNGTAGKQRERCETAQTYEQPALTQPPEPAVVLRILS